MTACSVHGRPEKKKQGRPEKHTLLKNDVLSDSLGVRGSYLAQKKDMDAENDLRLKNYSAGYPISKNY